ncbi:ribosomal RNA-processing protein 17-like [Dendroctonus ponderosae]|uniref:Nucleolar protein 12 n=1 Tax=Dendroctonus ponderosae TaxID=77166 RepID=U4UV56_DENPD|nr:ribosomal RNA-processing protein 17-like [Dendroctonus ponderosae]ERL94116.1 hypothetical protein D910_11398 [Dendroctonus ponderosae]KAH1013152.1 hypothetical protein HUJ05_012178 [Dendroctonus ponderosae]KAH1013153.1 hypothetical protein HUJ05_012178 [Dendroctonus ponderosae]
MAVASVKRGNKKPKKRAKKVNLVFDEVKRRDFLTGFRKRKLQRKKHAQEKLENDLKEERKRLKSDAKESYKKLVVSHRDIPELEKYLSNEYEEDDVTVKVVELSTNEIAKQSNWIGANRPKYESDQEEEVKPEDPEEIPGMELKAKTPKATKVTKPSTKQFHSEKQVKKELKKQATKNVQKSKVFQKKNKMEQRKQKKQSLRANKLKEGAKQKFGKKGNKKGRFTKRNKDTD